MAKQSFSIDVPSKPDDLIKLAQKILEKDAKLAANSPFRNIKDWGDFPDLVTAAGHNVCIPYQDRPNRGRRIRTYPVTERNEAIYIWHDVEGREPYFEAPDVFDAMLRGWLGG